MPATIRALYLSIDCYRICEDIIFDRPQIAGVLSGNGREGGGEGGGEAAER